MNSRLTASFRRQFDDLPQQVQAQAESAYGLWRANAYHASLEFKRVSQRQPVYSVRIGLGWRALGLREHDTLYWFWIGSHSNYDELLKRL